MGLERYITYVLVATAIFSNFHLRSFPVETILTIRIIADGIQQSSAPWCSSVRGPALGTGKNKSARATSERSTSNRIGQVSILSCRF